ncbi:MAG: hypothetical protein AB7G93_05695 [Bdellovibrionales bacterium]
MLPKASFFNFSFNKYFRLTTVCILAFELTLGPVAHSAAPSSGPSLPGTPRIADIEGNGDDANLVTARAFREGRDFPLGTSTVSFMADAKVHVFNGKETLQYTLSLDEILHQKLHPQFVAPLRFRIENRRLVIEAWIGADQSGEGGKLISFLELPHLPNVVGFTRDRHLLSIITENGDVWTTDVAALTHLYPTVPMFFKTGSVAHLGLDLSGRNVQAKFLTPGSASFTLDDVYPNAVLPELDGKVFLGAGDLLITAEIEGRRRVLGVHSRSMIHECFKAQFRYHAYRALLLKNDPTQIQKLRAILEEAQSGEEEFARMVEAIEKQEGANPAVALALKAIPEQSLDVLLSRARWHGRAAANARDGFTLMEWPERLRRLREHAEIHYPDADPARLAEMVERNWQLFVNPSQERPVTAEDGYEIPTSYYVKTYAFMAAVSVVGLGFAASTLDPTIVKQVGALDYLFNTIITEVLQHPEYTWHNLGSVVSQFIVIPVILMASIYAGNAISLVGITVDDWKNSLGVYLRDFSRKWGSSAMTSWQRIVTFGERVFGKAQSAHLRMIEGLMRQRTLIPAISAGVNPFEVVEVKTEGEVKQRLVGFMNPFQGKDSLARETVEKVRGFSEIVNERDRLRQMAFLLAAAAIEEQYNVDPATLIILGESNTSLTHQQIRDLLEDPRKAQEHEITTEEIHRAFLRLPRNLRSEIAESLPAEIQRQYSFHRTIAQRIVAMDPTRKTLKQLRTKCKRLALSVLKGTLNLGRQHYDTLNTDVASRYAAAATGHGFMPDWIMMVLYPAVHGDRAKLDKPDDLAASSNPWTGWNSYPHLADQAMGVIIHFIIASSRNALLFAKKMLEVPDDAYRPMEEIQYASRLTHEGFWKSLVGWVSASFNPLRADIGGFILTRQLNELTIVQGYFLLAVLSRVFLGQQSFDDAFFAFWYFWLSGLWFFALPWLPVQQGYKAYSEEFDGRDQNLVTARSHLAQSQRDVLTERAEKLKSQGFAEIRGLYAQYRPRLLEELDALIASGDVAAVIQFTLDKPPYEKAPNSGLFTSLNWAVGLLTTALGLILMVNSYHDEYLTASNIGMWAVLSASFTGIAWLGLSRAAWERWDYAGKLRRASERVGLTAAAAEVAGAISTVRGQTQEVTARVSGGFSNAGAAIQGMSARISDRVSANRCVAWLMGRGSVDRSDSGGKNSGSPPDRSAGE